MLSLVVFLTIGGIIFAQTDDQIEKYTRNREDRVAWWKEARYGMFVHWGVYAQLAGEWKGKRIDGPGEWIMFNARIPIRIPIIFRMLLPLDGILFLN